VASRDASHIVLLGEHCEQSLRDRWNECREQGKEGVPRHELLVALRSAAEALDALDGQYHLQHLALHPGNLLLRKGRLLLGDFGLAALLWLPGRDPVSLVNPRYAAPELAQNCPGPAADQYSLALIYAEMLTGRHPRKGQSGSSSGLSSSKSRRTAPLPPDLSLLSQYD